MEERMERRGWLPFVAVVAALLLMFGGAWFVGRLMRRSHDDRTVFAPLDSTQRGDPSASDSINDDPLGTELQAERVPLEPPPPPREGMVRYRARLVRSDKKRHSYYMSVATPAGSSESQTIPPSKDGNVTVDAPAECRAIDFASHGFVTVHHVITQREVEREDLGNIVFEQAARLEVAILHAPRRADAWLHFDLMVKVEVSTGWGDSIGFGNEKLATPDGSAHSTYFVPSDTEIRLGLSGDGVCLRRVIPSFPAGTTPYVIDFAQLRSLHGRVVGIPARVAKGATLWFGRITANGDSLFPAMDAYVPLDDKGGFFFPAIPDGPFALRLHLSYLREAGGTHREWWQAEAIPPERELVVEPIEPLLGLEVGPIDGSTREERSCHVDFDGPVPSYVLTQPDEERRVARGLMRAASLESATRAVVWIGSDRGNCRQLVIPIERVPRPRDGVVSLRLDERTRATASLTVSLPIFASRDWVLYLVKSGARLDSLSDRISVRRERGLFSFTFSDLEAGSYDVLAWRGVASYRVIRNLALAEGESVSVDVTLPNASQIEGRVTNWNDIPAALRPDGIGLESWGKIVDGRFTLLEVRPIGGKARFTGPQDQSVGVEVDVATLDDGTLAVAYPLNEVELFDVQTSVPASMHVYASIVDSYGPKMLDELGVVSCRRASVDSHGTISILRRRGEPLHGWVNASSADDDRRILAWFSSDVPTGTIVPEGRFVEAANGADGTTAKVVLVPRAVGDWQPPRIEWFKVIAGLPRRFWLPAGVEFLDVEFAGRPTDRVPAASIGAQWTIAPK